MGRRSAVGKGVWVERVVLGSSNCERIDAFALFIHIRNSPKAEIRHSWKIQAVVGEETWFDDVV